MKKCICCDLDGPILDGISRHYNCYSDIIEKYGGIPLAVEEYWLMKRNMISRKELLVKSCFQGSYDAYLKEWLENIEEKKYLDFDVLKTGAKSTVSNWKQLGFEVKLITQRQNTDNLFWQLKKLSIHDLFDTVYTCSIYDKDSKLSALKQIKDSIPILMIGDTEIDMDAASRFGISSIAVTTGLREQKFLKADFYVADINQIDLSSMVN